MSTVAAERLTLTDVHCPHCGHKLKDVSNTKWVTSVRSETAYRCSDCKRPFVIAQEKRIVYVRLKTEAELSDWLRDHKG